MDVESPQFLGLKKDTWVVTKNTCMISFCSEIVVKVLNKEGLLCYIARL